MTKIEVNIPENKLEFFKSLIENLGLDYVDVKEEEDLIPQWQQEEVLNRIANATEENYTSWSEAKTKIKR